MNAPIPVDDNAGLFLDVDSGLFSTGAPIAGYDLNFFEQAGTQLLQLRAPNNGIDGGLGFNAAPYTYLSNLPANTAVPPNGATPVFVPYGILAAVDSNGAGPRHGPWANGITGGFIGFRFVSANQQTLYGWARLNVYAGLAPSGGNVGVLVDYAFEDSGAPIFAGQLPTTNIKSLSKSGGTITVRVPSLAGIIYQLEKNDSLTNPNGWSLVSEKPGTGAEIDLMDATAGSAPNGRRFYRVVEVLPPQ
ncbi:MAG: hypothetical protein ACXV9Q_02780 [Chthoniobacterales bacterium]